MSTFAEIRTKLSEAIDRYEELESVNAPDCIMAAEAAIIIRKLLLLHPEAWVNLGESLNDYLRQSHGICNQCDNEIPARMTHPLQCAACNTKDDIEFPSQN